MLDLADLPSAARYYAELGYAVFPCVRGTKSPLTPNGFKDATTDLAQLEAWWERHPTANIAIATGGLLVVDFDGEDHPWPEDDERRAELSRGPIARTPHEGIHHFYRQPQGRAWRNTTGKLAHRVDTRADGGYVLVAPSVVEGKQYRWQPGFELAEPPGMLPEPPLWLCEMLDRLHETKETAAPVAGNPIPTGQRNASLARMAGTMRRAGMTLPEIRASLLQANADRCQPPLDPDEVERIAQSIARYAPDSVTVALIEDHYGQDFKQSTQTIFSAAATLCREYPELCKPIIHGLLREGETMNVIAAPKTGKSWLVLNLALSVATGQAWLEYPTEPGAVLLLDNELHPETLANRIPRVAEAMRLPVETWKDRFYVRSLRGQLEDLFRMEDYFNSLPTGFFKLIVLDAFYRFMPKDMDENDNGTMANLYNVIDRCARKLRTGFVLIHHTSKGIQSGKGVTDVGAGAGAQSRAADCHLVLRSHEQDACLSVDAVTRSWSSPKPFVIRSAFPLWIPDHTLDPANLKKPEQYARSRSQNTAAEDEEPVDPWTAETFAQTFVGEEPKLKSSILVKANEEKISDYKAEKLLDKAEAKGLVHRWVQDGNRIGYANRPQPSLKLESKEDKPESKRAQVIRLLQSSPSPPTREIAAQCVVSTRYVQKIRCELDANKHANNGE